MVEHLSVTQRKNFPYTLRRKSRNLPSSETTRIAINRICPPIIINCKTLIKMSLHIANLTPRIRKDEIERVFRRFGRCSVHLRNGYGFVVYDLQGDAEIALRSLRGKKICGESIYLSLSKEQPKPLQKFVTTAKTREVQYGRRSGNGVNDVHHHFSRDQNHYSVRDRHPNDRRGTHNSTELHDDRGNFKRSNMGVEQRQEDKKGNDVNDHMRLDRYEPEIGDERHDGYRNIDLEPLGGSPTRKTSLVDNKVVHHRDNTRSHRGCFRCGEVGHKMRDCPLEVASRGKSLNHSDRSPTNQVNTNDRGGDGVGQGARLQSRRRSSTSARRHEADRKSLIVENNEVEGSSSLVLSQSIRNTRKNYSRKRQREKESQSLEVHIDKKSKILSMPPFSHTSPELSTHASREVFPDSMVLSKAQLPVSYFCSGSSMTKSRSNRSRSTSIRSKSRSRSRSPNSAFPVSLNQDLSSSPTISSELSAGVPNPPCKEVPSEVGEQLHPKLREEGLSVANIGDASLNVALENDQVPHSENLVHEEGKLCDPDLTQVLKHQITDMAVESEPVSISDEVKDDVQIDHLHNFDNDNLKEVKAPNQSLLELGDNSITAREIVLEKQKKNVELENANTFEMPKSPRPANNVDSKAPVKLHNKLCISKDDLVRVMKQYGLKELEIDEQHGCVEDYFGSARLWPWEIIYYRRLKKGLISTENYAKRVAQNNAFGITDKYIRSSSGWGELFDEHV